MLNQKSSQLSQRLLLYYSIMMTVVFFSFAAILFFTSLWTDLVDGINRYILGGLTVLYAVFRVVRIQRMLQNMKRNENN
jgi:hypothetical protein